MNTKFFLLVSHCRSKRIESATNFETEDLGLSASRVDGFVADKQALDELSPNARQHYTLEIFEEWLHTVQALESHLLLPEELALIAKYLGLSGEESAKYLFVRLFLRKTVWIRVPSLESYFPLPNPEKGGPRQADLLNVAIKELLSAGFLEDSDKSVLSLEEVLEVMSLEELRQMCSKEAWAKNVKSKTALSQELIKNTATQPGLASFPGWGMGTSNRRLNYVRRAQDVLGRMVRINEGCLSCFELVQIIYLREIPTEGKGMTSAIRVRIGNVRYPSYSVVRSIEVFRDRPQLDAYIHASNALSQVHLLLENRSDPERFSTAWEICQACVPSWQAEVGANTSFSGRYFLLRYTAGWIFTKLMEVGTSVLARQKLYTQEADILNQLIAQPNFRRGKRGDWYVRLALVQHTHFVDRRSGALSALATCLRGLRDPYVSPSCLNDLITRIGRLQKLKIKDTPLVSLAGPELSIPSLARYRLRELPEVILEGERTRSSYIEAGTRMIYRAQDGAEITVEALALDHYHRKGYMGYHCEGSLIGTLFGLLFWDILFPTILVSLKQPSSPAHWIFTLTPSLLIAAGEAASILTRTHEREFERQPAAVGIKWSFPLAELLDLCRCIGGPPLASILRAIAKQYRDRRAGFPDLTLWHPEKGIARFAEVKGPNDHLSQKQRIWLNDLLKAGLRAELCTVKLTDEALLMG
ncbi:hypothetical protein DSO57_1002422 [Entomophthora muscae]|uniref:Uncharacterized protein n=1 Tax=Entomophthora muscae TaxID=34485 RepID=A0ACC2SAX6_9FUNG|nr:hypothetical protein DSO57_1002422 [Entomophthora muscae]